MKIIPFPLDKDMIISYWRYMKNYTLFDAHILKGCTNAYICIDDDKVFSTEVIESPLFYNSENISNLPDGWVHYTYAFEASTEVISYFRNGHLVNSCKLFVSEANAQCIKGFVDAYAYMVHSLFNMGGEQK